jgi:hypothetical protein
LLMSATLVAGGCGPNRPTVVPVEGVVVFADGEPVRGGQIELESVTQKVNARGPISPDGAFRLTTYREGDGAVPGEHRVIVQPSLPVYGGLSETVAHKPHGETPRTVPVRFGDYRTSELTATVTEGRLQPLRIVLPDDSR